MIDVKEVGNYGKNAVGSIETETYFVPIVNGKELSMIAETRDVALLLGIGYKYCGQNNQFARFACRMLGIISAWAE